MSFRSGLKDSILGFIYMSKTFCFCLPVRFGVIMMALLTMLLAGILSIIIWFEVSTHELTKKERMAFIAAGVTETSLFLASIIGFSGAIVRKQLFVVTYAYFMYTHLLLNIGIASFFIWVVTHTEQNDAVSACKQAIQDKGGQLSCTGLFTIARDVFIGIAGGVLLVEFYGVLVLVRYVHQLHTEKSRGRELRMNGDVSGTGFIPKRSKYDSVSTNHRGMGPNLYDDYEQYAPDYIPRVSMVSARQEAYGGGRWTHQEIVAEEKQVLFERDEDVGELHMESTENLVTR